MCGKYSLYLVIIKAENLIAIQLAIHWGVKVIATVSKEEQAEFLKQTGIQLEKIIVSKKSNISEDIMKETNGIGVDYILEGYKRTEISKQEIIKCLGTILFN